MGGILSDLSCWNLWGLHIPSLLPEQVSQFTFFKRLNLLQTDSSAVASKRGQDVPSILTSSHITIPVTLSLGALPPGKLCPRIVWRGMAGRKPALHQGICWQLNNIDDQDKCSSPYWGPFEFTGTDTCSCKQPFHGKRISRGTHKEKNVFSGSVSGYSLGLFPLRLTLTAREKQCFWRSAGKMWLQWVIWIHKQQSLFGWDFHICFFAAPKPISLGQSLDSTGHFQTNLPSLGKSKSNSNELLAWKACEFPVQSVKPKPCLYKFFLGAGDIQAHHGLFIKKV